MSVLGAIGKWMGIALGALLILVGLPILAIGMLPGDEFLVSLRELIVEASYVLTSFDQLGVPVDLPEIVDGAFDNPIAVYGIAPVGLILVVGLLLTGRTPKISKHEEFDEDGYLVNDYVVPVDKKVQRKARKQASAIAKAGSDLEAAEVCFESGLFDEAASYFIKASELIRAAEIRHDQERLIESAELYMEAGSYDTAGSIFAGLEEWLRSGEAYLKSGNKSVAAEMFESAGEWRQAADCYESADFSRHAAKAYVKCAQWKKAAVCLEQVITEGMTGAAASDPRNRAENTKLVRMAGDLYQRAGDEQKAMLIFERGECWVAAAEIAVRLEENEHAVELFVKAQEIPRAADVLKLMGQDEEALRILAEYHRDRGEDEEAAKHFEAAGEWMAAGDLYRLLEQHLKAADCYERFGEYAQAAEMFSQADLRDRAAENYEKAACHAEAAECYSLIGNSAKEAEMLAKSGEHLRSGALLHEQGEDDGAIKVLQQIPPEHADFCPASAILGEIFRQRGMMSLALKKLIHAVGNNDLTRENIQAFYGLATVYEANKDVEDALELYEKIQVFDYGHRDVDERMARCKQMLEQQASKQNAAQSSPFSGSQADGRYAITGKLGRGGMGIVYKARDTVLDRTVAFKVLPDAFQENPQALKNFLREAKSAAQLNHPNIVTVYDAGEQNGVYYIAMEYVDGNTLKEIVKAKGHISPGGILHVLAQMCEGLAFAHEKKIVHRDIKTANTMWTRDRQAKIMDFGLAKVIEEVRNHTTVVSGTPYYMSPEQTLGKNVDHRTDIYSLGVTIFELATGTLPFREGNLPYHHVHTPPPSPTEFVSDLPPLIVHVIEKCLRKKPDDRYQSTREILTEIKSAMKS
ncbi:MAG: protein kinase [Myxococcales bacterium]|nr:protein kinase [Myxococcales bacterium]